MSDETSKFEFALQRVNREIVGELQEMLEKIEKDIDLHTMNPGVNSEKMLQIRMNQKRDMMKRIDEINVCCNEEEKRMLIEFGLELNERYPMFPLEKIFIVLIFSYYGHNLLEQSGEDLYSDQFIIKDKRGNYKDPQLKRIFDTIYFKIGSSDEPIFKKIRRAFLGFKSGGRRHKRTKRGRSTKNKTRRHKRRHTRKH
jgi:hypothetical protein